jgi:hypothetical protein
MILEIFSPKNLAKNAFFYSLFMTFVFEKCHFYHICKIF